MAQGSFEDLASVFGKQPDHVWSTPARARPKLAVGAYKAYGGKTTFISTSGATALAGFEVALKIDATLSVEAHGPVAERLLSLIVSDGEALGKTRPAPPRASTEVYRWTAPSLSHPLDPTKRGLVLVGNDLASALAGLQVVLLEAPEKSSPKKPVRRVSAPSAGALATSAGVPLTAALEALWALPSGSTFEEYEGMEPSAGVARAVSLRKLVASKVFQAKTRSREYASDGGRVQPVHFDRGWIPFAEDGGGNLLCLDTNPGPKGRANQILQWEIRGGGAFVRAPSLKAFRAKLA